MDARIHVYQDENGNVELSRVCFFVKSDTSYSRFRNEFNLAKFDSIQNIWEKWTTPSGQVLFYAF